VYEVLTFDNFMSCLINLPLGNESSDSTMIAFNTLNLTDLMVAEQVEESGFGWRQLGSINGPQAVRNTNQTGGTTAGLWDIAIINSQD
jgi:hypothetical protein